MMDSPQLKTKAKRKILRKQARCKNILLKNESLETVDYPTRYMFVGNGGLIVGVQRESLMDLFTLHGAVEDIIMVPDKSYSFVIYSNEKEAEIAMDKINGHKLNESSESVLYLLYIKDVPQKNMIKNELPPGLVLIPDYVTEDEEKLLLVTVEFDDDKGAMKHRKVKHFGYKFNYSNNNVDKNNPLDEKIPDVFISYLEKLVTLGHISKIPDQLTVNHYMPGQGIPPHIDTHSAFEDSIISLSLGSQVVMDFYGPGNLQIPVVLPQRSLLIMKGESRYLWKHGITPRKTDVVPVFGKDSCYLTLAHRTPRTSFTFRVINREQCQCEYKDKCDSQIESSRCCSHEPVTEKQAKQLENIYVTQVYENIAEHFSETRCKPWPQVARFMDEVPPGSVVVDAGCGNGKNISGKNNCYKIGCDVSEKLVEVCVKRNLQVVVGDIMNLPFRDECADVCICIAVIHHIATKSRRIHAVKEIIRILRPGGKALIYVWALEQDGPEGPSNYLKYNKVADKENKDFGKPKNEFISVPLSGDDLPPLDMLVHNNRTHFVEQDVLVPWHMTVCGKSPTDKNMVYHRYYHVFKQGELDSLVEENGVELLNSYYDKGNWCVVFKKPV